MKKLLLGLFLLAGIMSPASAQFGLPSLGGSKPAAGGGNIDELIAKFNAQNILISSATANSLEQIIAALGDKQSIAEEKEKYENIQKITDTGEKAKQEGTLIEDAAGKAQKLLDSSDAQEKMKNLSPQMQQKVAKAIFNVGVAGFQIPGMLETGKKALEIAASNPLQHGAKVLSAKDAVVLFTKALPKMVQIGSSGFKLLQDVKIKADSPSASAELQSTKDDPFAGK
jgi:hypothetical protein